MARLNIRGALLCGAASLAALASQTMAQPANSTKPPPNSPPQTQPAAPAASAASTTVKDVVVTARRLNAGRAAIEPETGASTYSFTKQAVEDVSGGGNEALNQVVLQAPGVSQDSFGQLHVRDDHNNIQFRIDGVILPEGISVFGQALSPRIIQNVSLITGALPAEFGLRTAGIINITTKDGVFDNGGTASIYGGSRGEYEPSLTYGGSSGNTNFFISGSFLQDELGVESPNGSVYPDHDRTDQIQGFGFLEHTLDPSDRLSLIVGTSNERFDIPNTPGLEPTLGLNVLGQTTYPSALLSSNQLETTDYAIASWLHVEGRLSSQVSVYTRYSTLTYRPALNSGELLYNGVSESASKQDDAYGLQAEAAYTLNRSHTLRTGLILEGERAISRTLSYVLPVDADGVQTSDAPQGISDNGAQDQFEYSYYLQDEWKALHNLTINYGLRFDQVNAYLDAGQISPRFNLVWLPYTGSTLHLGYSRYFTPPPFELVGREDLSKFANTTAAPQVLQDGTPKSERTDYYDLGGEQKFGRHITIGVDGYYRQSQNLIDEGQFGAPIILTPFNYRDGIIKGIELTGNYVAGPFTAYANFAWERGMGKDIETSQFNFNAAELAYIKSNYIFLDHNQTYTASAGAAYQLGKSRFSTDLIYGSGLREDKMLPDGNDIPNGAAVPTYIQVNVSASRAMTLAYAGKIDVRFDVVNLFNRIYEIRSGTGVGVGAPQYGPGRGLFAGLTKNF
jgi:outer membrane receptor for ferrienterochelin and colicins